MNLKKNAKLLVLLIALTSSIGAKAAEFDLFQSTLDYERGPDLKGPDLKEPDLYEQAKQLIDSRILELNNFPNFNISAFEKDDAYFVRKDCGNMRSDKKLFDRHLHGITLNGTSMTANPNWRETLLKVFNAESGIVPHTNVPNAMMQSACYLSKKLGEMAKDGYSYQIKITYSDPYYALKVIEISPKKQANVFSLLRTSSKHQLIQFLDENADQKVVKKYTCLYESNRSLFSVMNTTEQMDFQRFRQDLLDHLKHTMAQHFKIKFTSFSGSGVQPNPEPVIEQQIANTEQNPGHEGLEAEGINAVNDPEENAVTAFFSKLKFW